MMAVQNMNAACVAKFYAESFAGLDSYLMYLSDLY